MMSRSRQGRRSLQLESLETRKLMAGDLDSTFNFGNGYSVSDIDLSNEQVMDMALQNDGKMLLAGSSDFGTGDANFMIGRFNSNGQLDLSFGGHNGVPAGYVVTDFGGSEAIQQVFVLDDGDILAGGYNFTPEGNTVVHLFRYNSDGTPEELFGIDGEVVIEWPGINAGFEMGVAADKILLRFGDIVMRLNADQGLLDDTFVGGGAINTEFFFQFDANRMDVLGDDIYLSGTDDVTGDFTVMKMDINATLDLSYGTNGRANLDASIDNLKDAILDGQGRLLAVDSDMLFRLTDDGEMDSQLHVDGIVNVNDMNASQVIAQPGGLISIVGYTPGGSHDVSIRRFGNDGTVDNSFGVAGKSMQTFGGADYVYASSAISLANKDILIAGRIRELDVSSNDLLVSRIDGSNSIQIDPPTDDLKSPDVSPSRPGKVANFADNKAAKGSSPIVKTVQQQTCSTDAIDQCFLDLDRDLEKSEGDELLPMIVPILG